MPSSLDFKSAGTNREESLQGVSLRLAYNGCWWVDMTEVALMYPEVKMKEPVETADGEDLARMEDSLPMKF